MIDWFPLPLLPPGSLANSVVTTVWLGVLVVGFFNLRFGWVLSGLVVPGYLAPLLIAKPWAAVAVGVEGVVTYFLVWFYSERMSRWLGVAGLFGRDRFFAMVLCSILVRILFDGGIFPYIGEWLNQNLHLQFDYRYNLHSFGLIVVSLIANQFWKTGLRRGLIPFAVTVGLTWFLVRFGLMELTNFSISNLSYMYEDAAASMLASPKSYIILITAAFIASRMNLLYGWDFNGILIPSLLALQWYQPEKLLVSFVEALVVLGIGIGILALPHYQGKTMEGARKLMLFFNISFAWKIALGFLLLRFFPQVKVSDYFGFGYMLSTLMAVKMHDKEIVARLTRAILQTSLVAVAGATVMGFALTFVSMPLSWSVIPSRQQAATPPAVMPESGLVAVMRSEKQGFYGYAGRVGPVDPLPAEADLFSGGVRLLRQYTVKRDKTMLREAEETFERLNYHISNLADRYLLLREGEPRRGWGSYVLTLEPRNRMVVEVPAPLDEWGTLEAGTWLFERSGAMALLVAGTARDAVPDGGGDVLRNRQTPFHLFHRAMADGEPVQVRAFGQEARRVLARERTSDLEGGGQLRVRGTLPAGLDMPTLKAFAPALVTLWEEPPFVNIQREESRGSFAELFFGREGLREILLSALKTDATPRLMVEERRIDGYLQDWLFSSKEAIAPRGSDLYQPPSLGELLYWDREILTPLIRIAREEYISGTWSQAGMGELRAVSAAAARFGYEVTRYRYKGTDTDFLLLVEVAGTARRHWGAYALRLGPAREYLIQAPRPLYEGTSFEFAVHLFESLQGRWLLIGGTHPDANRDGSADLIRPRSPHHIFNLVSQVVLREAGEEPMLALQCRSFGIHPGRKTPDKDLLIALHDGVWNRAAMPPLGEFLWRKMEDEGLELGFVNGSSETSGYEVGLLPQARYLDATRNKSFAVLWLAPDARRGFRQQADNRVQEARFRALGIPSRQADFSRVIQGLSPSQTALSEPVREGVRALQEHGDVIPLMQAMATQSNYRLERILDLNTAQEFLVVSDARGAFLLAANLDPRELKERITWPGGDDITAVRTFIERRSGWLEAVR